MMTEYLAVDPYRNAYSSKASFDMSSRASTPQNGIKIIRTDERYNPEISRDKTQSIKWDPNVSKLVSSRKWLQNYGLKKNKLSINQLLPSIGFKASDDFDLSLKQPISSRYGEGLFSKMFHPGGRTYKITCGREKLKQIENRLVQAVLLYKRRLEWLTSESRRLFGVIEEKSMTIVIDIRNMSPQQFDQYRMVLEKVIYEQIGQVAKFNLIRAADDMQLYQPECVPVSHDTLQGAIKWLWNLDRLASVSKTATCEAVLKAVADKHNEAIYLYTEGTAIDTCRELMKEKVVQMEQKIPIHVVSYNCDNSETMIFLRDLARVTGAKFHAYAVIMEMDSYEGLPIDPHTNRANIVLKKKTYGGVPAGAGMREDVIFIFEELEEARNIMAQIQALIDEVPEPKVVLDLKIEKCEIVEKDEQYMSSHQWLQTYGLSAKKLDLFDILGGIAFKHRDGVVNIKEAPVGMSQKEAVNSRKLINAKYCNRFPVVKWKDGGVVHVQVTPEIHRLYEQRMQVAMNVIQQRIDWLSQGSRALFGTVIEEQMYILIDTSSSMLPSIQFVKDKLFILMQEQLRHKKKVNIVAFNSKALPWQPRLVNVSEQALQNAWKWIQNLTCWGTTNTYAALQLALSDPGSQGIYLLTDGRPDQPPKTIIAQVQMHHIVPIHTISFNCNDTEANQFLYDLAQATAGRYHYFSQKGEGSEQPEAWESEDIKLLKDELRKGWENLDKISELRDECANLSWISDVKNVTKSARECPSSASSKISNSPFLLNLPVVKSPSQIESPVQDLEEDELKSPLPERPSSAPPRSPLIVPSPPPRPSSALGFYPSVSSLGRPLSSARAKTARLPRKPPTASHTRTSLLRTLNSSGRFTPNEWLLPETKKLFEHQAERREELATVERKIEKTRKMKKKKIVRERDMSSKVWLSKNSLSAKKLTILDILSPTFVPHKAKYVPVIDKFVLAKVFDDILPIAHISGKDKKQVKLLNPSAVNLLAYEEKVRKAISCYHRRLNLIVWEALPKSVQNEFDEDGPMSFEDNKLHLMQALDEAGCPLMEQDILLLEEEIARGRKYLNQSESLRNVTTKDGDDEDDVTVYDDQASLKSSLTARSNQEFEVGFGENK